MAATGNEIVAAAAEDHIPNEETSVDVDALLREKKLVLWVKIPRVPERLRGGEDDAYEPKIISFGPYHRLLDRLKDMEEHKERYLQNILLRCGCPRDELKNKIEELEGCVRRCYSKDIDKGLEDENGEFLNMMMLDGCFIVEYFIELHLSIWDAELENMMRGVHDLVLVDMLLLENQVPFFLLEHIFNHVKEHQPQLSQLTFMDLCCNYFKIMLDEDVCFQLLMPAHLLQLYHSTFHVNSMDAIAAHTHMETKHRKKRNATERKQRQKTIIIPNAALLQAKGITLKESKKVKGSSILDVKFIRDNGVLEIPNLVVDSFTKSQFRNLIAFEELCPILDVFGNRFHGNFTMYALFMDCIVNTPDDVALLYQKGILQHRLASDKDVADLFNNMTNGTFIHRDPDHYLSPLFEEVKDFRIWFWPRWLTNLMLKLNYFTSPWASVSVPAAALGLILSIVQTAFTIHSSFKSSA